MPDDPSTTSTDAPGAHDHSGMAVPDEPGERFGAPGCVNGLVLALVVGASIDGCRECQGIQLDALQADPLTLARLVELSAIAMQSIAGGVPPAMYAEDDPLSQLGEHYRAMLRAGIDRDQHAPMYGVALALTAAERRAVAEDALDMLAGVLTIGPGA